MVAQAGSASRELATGLTRTSLAGASASFARALFARASCVPRGFGGFSAINPKARSSKDPKQREFFRFAKNTTRDSVVFSFFLKKAFGTFGASGRMFCHLNREAPC